MVYKNSVALAKLVCPMSHPWHSIPDPRIDARSYSCVIDDDEARDITAGQGQAGIIDTVVSS